MLTNLENVKRFLVTGGTDDFAFDFPYWHKDEIKAYITLEDNSITELTQGTDYTLTDPDPSGGTVHKVTAWTDATILTVYREVPLTQEIDLINGEKIDGEQLEEGLDLKVAGLQQLNEKFSRSVMTSIDEAGEDMVIPNKQARIGAGDGTLLGFDGTGGNITLRDLKQFDIDVAATASNATAAANSATLASKWAENPEDTPVEPSAYSAKHWAIKAGASASSASASATTATNEALDSEAFAIGERGGVPVGNTDPAYHNNTKYYYDLVVGAISGALRYQGTWTTTGATDYSGISTPRSKGDLFYCQGTACTIDGVTYTQGDLIIFNNDVADGGTITTSVIDKIDNTETVTPDNTATLSNKTIAFGSNTMTDVASTNTTQTLTNKTIESTDNTLNIDRTDVHFTYSTSEQKTGDKWIDGKDIYALILKADSIPPSTSGSRVTFSATQTGTFDTIIEATGAFIGHGGADDGIARSMFGSDMSTGLAFRSTSMWTLSADKTTFTAYWFGSASVTAFANFTSGSIVVKLLYTKST